MYSAPPKMYKAIQDRGLNGERDNEGNFKAAPPEISEPPVEDIYTEEDKKVALIMQKLEDVLDTGELEFLVNYINKGGLNQNEN